MTNVGDVYADFVDAFFNDAERDRVIKILGILRIDGECEHLTEIISLRNLFFRKAFVNSLRLAQHMFRETEWQIEFCHDRMDLRFIFSRLSEDLEYLCFRAFVTVAPTRY